MGSPEAKELLPDAEGRPLIQWGLDQAFSRGWSAHVVVREGKSSLIEYLTSKYRQPDPPAGMTAGELSWQEIKPSSEWPDTLIRSEAYWQRKVIVVLPDTRFFPVSVLDAINDSLDRNLLVYGTFPVLDPEHWGVLQLGSSIDPQMRPVGSREEDHFISEKSAVGAGPFRAWGLMGFVAPVGIPVLRAHLQSTQARRPEPLPVVAATVPLTSFIDLARP